MAFRDQIRDKHVMIRSDNTTAISFIKKMGGMSCYIRDQFARQIWLQAWKLNAWISIAHIPEVQNLAVDRASRVFHPDLEWAIPQHIFDRLNAQAGPFEVDLFASMSNHKLPNFYSWTPDPLCLQQGRIQDLIRGGAQIVTGLKLPFWGLSFVEFWYWGLIFGGQGGGPGPWDPPWIRPWSTGWCLYCFLG